MALKDLKSDLSKFRKPIVKPLSEKKRADVPKSSNQTPLSQFVDNAPTAAKSNTTAPREDGATNGWRDAFLVKFTTGTSNVGVTETKSEFIIYPNPTSKELRVKIEYNLIGSKFRILNTLGQELKQGELTSTMSNIDVSKLPKGYYVLILGEGNHSYKFLVN